jgi:hypothetical protein
MQHQPIKILKCMKCKNFLLDIYGDSWDWNTGILSFLWEFFEFIFGF